MGWFGWAQFTRDSKTETTEAEREARRHIAGVDGTADLLGIGDDEIDEASKPDGHRLVSEFARDVTGLRILCRAMAERIMKLEAQLKGGD